MAYLVARRTREIGIRVALGAGRGGVLRLVVGEGARLAALGVGVGLVASLGASRAVARLLYGVSPTDPLTFAGTAALLGGVALLACWVPARRAARVDPVRALRDG
jgi:ABC-type antimicrobial peptide transport system permease subunit